MAKASDRLAKLRKAYPPRFVDSRGVDRVQRLYQSLAPVLPPQIRDLCSNGLLAIGEVGRSTPDVEKISFKDGSSMIEFTSGMMDFLDAFARVLSGRFVRDTVSGPRNQPALSPDEVAQQIEDLFIQWKVQWKWYERWFHKSGRIRSPKFDTPDDVRSWTNDIVSIAELFILAHEIGHIVLDKGILLPLTANAEKNADTIGMILVTKLPSIGREDLAFRFAGAVLAIRIIVGLEKVGVLFSGAYPHQDERLTSISAYMLSICPSRQYFHEISRIAVAYQDMMDTVEGKIVKPPDLVRADTERIIVRLIAQLLQVAQSRVGKEKLITDIFRIAEQTPVDVMRQVGDTLHKYYVAAPLDESFIDQDMKKKMGALILEVLSELPEQVRMMLTR